MSPPASGVRPGVPADRDVVAALEQECLGADAWSVNLVEQGLAGLPTVSYFVVEGPQGVVGHAVLSVAADIAELQRIAVAPECRRRGLAGRLLGAVLVAAAAGGADRLLLEVREDNAGARSFYAAHGFVEIDRRRRYYRDGTSAVVMQIPVGTMAP